MSAAARLTGPRALERMTVLPSAAPPRLSRTAPARAIVPVSFRLETRWCGVCKSKARLPSTLHSHPLICRPRLPILQARRTRPTWAPARPPPAAPAPRPTRSPRGNFTAREWGAAGWVRECTNHGCVRCGRATHYTLAGTPILCGRSCKLHGTKCGPDDATCASQCCSSTFVTGADTSQRYCGWADGDTSRGWVPPSHPLPARLPACLFFWRPRSLAFRVPPHHGFEQALPVPALNMHCQSLH